MAATPRRNDYGPFQPVPTSPDIVVMIEFQESYDVFF